MREMAHARLPPCSRAGVKVNPKQLRISIGGMCLAHNGHTTKLAPSSFDYAREYLLQSVGRCGAAGGGGGRFGVAAASQSIVHARFLATSSPE